MDNKKLTVMIADDDYNICILIKSLIDWDDLELECVGVYYNGEDIFEEIKRTKPDIVLTDIKMPGIDGLELVNRVQNMRLETEFILLSGYKNFNYAHTAIKYGIRNYLLKPINKNELKQNLLDIKARITGKRNAIKERAMIKGRLIQDYKLLRMHLMRDIVSGQWDCEGKTLETLNRAHATRFKKGVFCIVGFKPDPKILMTADQYAAILKQVGELFASLVKSCFHDYISYQSDYVLYTLICSPDKETAIHIVQDSLRKINEFFSDNAVITAGFSQFDEVISNQLMDQVQCTLAERMDTGTGDVILFKKECLSESSKKELPFQNTINSLVSYIEIASISDIEKWFDTQVHSGYGKDTSATVFWKGINRLIDICRAKIKELYEPESLDALDGELYFAISCTTKRTDMLRAVGKWLISLLDAYVKGKKEHGKWYIRQAKKYIADHYSENIVLEDIAGTLFISPVYFSSLFKNEEGINFSEYLIKYRIEEAKRLLKAPEWTISQIAKAVGYSDSSYLTKLFKKKVGVSPKDYRKLHL